MNTRKTAAQIEEDEGRRKKAYLDTEGILTIGVGHNCKDSPVPGVNKVGDRISQEMINGLLVKDMAKAVRDCTDAFPWMLEQLNDPRQAVLVNMTFNMGIGSKTKRTGVQGFQKALQSMELGLYADAAKEMLNSKWAKQVGRRAIRLAEQMRLGEWVQHKRST